MCRFKFNVLTVTILAVALCGVFPSTAQEQGDWQYEPALEAMYWTIPGLEVADVRQEYGLKGLRRLHPYQVSPIKLGKEDELAIVVSDSELPLIYLVLEGSVEYFVINELITDPQSPLQTGIASLATGDLNDDGVDEIVVLPSTTNGPTILVVSYQEHTFKVTARMDIPLDADRRTVAVAVKDLNRDGLRDIVTSSGIFYQRNAGCFAEFAPFPRRPVGEQESVVTSKHCMMIEGDKTCVPVHASGFDLQVADMDGNGFPDVSYTFYQRTPTGTEYGLAVLLQTASMVFTDPVVYWLSDATEGFAVGDLNDDGKEDIAIPVGANPGHLVVLYQNTKGRFDSVEVFPAYEAPSSPAISDLNGDGLNDVVVLSWGRAAVFCQNTEQGLDPFVLYEFPIASYLGPRSLIVEDLDGDNITELICPAGNGNLVSVVTELPQLRGRGLAESETPSMAPYLPLLDTVTPSSFPDFLLVPLGATDSRNTRQLVTQASPHALTGADLNGDGESEVIVADGGHNPMIYIYYGSKVVHYDTGCAPLWSNVVSVAAGDLNGDDKDDIAVYAGQLAKGGRVVLLTESEDHQLTQMQVITSTDHLGGLQIADINQDGRNDLITAVGIYYQSPSHEFRSLSPFPGNYSFPDTEIADVEVADLNGDGLLDVARTFIASTDGRTTTGFEVMLQIKSGRFRKAGGYEHEGFLSATAHIATGDLTNNGKVDLVLTIEDVHDMALLFVQKDGALEEVEQNWLRSLKAPIVADIDGDGLNDLVGLSGSDRVCVFFQAEEGYFSRPVSYNTSTAQWPGPQGLSAYDMNGDGLLEVVSIANYDDGISVLAHAKLVASLQGNEEGTDLYWSSVLTSTVDSLSIVLAKRKLGLRLLADGRYESALSQLSQAVAMSQTAGFDYWTAYLLIAKGEIYHILGLWEDAFSAWDTAYTIFGNIGDFTGRQLALRNLGTASFLLQDYETALYYWQICYKWSTRLNWPSMQAVDANNIGVLYISRSDFDQAKKQLAFAARVNTEQGRRIGKVIALMNTGVIYGKEAAFDYGIHCFEQAETLLRDISYEDTNAPSAREIEWLLDFNLGVTHELSGQVQNAIDRYQQAIKKVEQIREQLSRESLKRSYWKKVRIVYERLIKLLIDQGQGVSAFLYAERCRARTFLDALYQGSITPDQLISPEAGISSGAVDPKAIDQAVKDARKDLQPNEAVLEYMVTDRGVYLWVITKDGVSVPIFIEYERAQLMNDVITLRKSLESDPPDQITMTEFLTSFYDKLVKKGLSKLPDGVDTLILIPSGPLWYLPFSALKMSVDATVGN